MYVSIKDLAVREGCSVSQVYRNVREMESSSLYPQGVKESGGLKINVDNYDDFLCRRRRMKWKKSTE